MPCRVEQRKGRRTVQYLAQRETRLDARNVRQARELVLVDLLVVLKIAGDDDKEVVVAPRHQMTPHNGLAPLNGRLKGTQGILALTLKRDLHRRRDAHPECLC